MKYKFKSTFSRWVARGAITAFGLAAGATTVLAAIENVQSVSPSPQKEVAAKLLDIRHALGELRPPAEISDENHSKHAQWVNWSNWGNYFNNWVKPWYNFNNWGNF
jgi:hypothetical protein